MPRKPSVPPLSPVFHEPDLQRRRHVSRPHRIRDEASIRQRGVCQTQGPAHQTALSVLPRRAEHQAISTASAMPTGRTVLRSNRPSRSPARSCFMRSVTRAPPMPANTRMKSRLLIRSHKTARPPTMQTGQRSCFIWVISSTVSVRRNTTTTSSMSRSATILPRSSPYPATTTHSLSLA